MNIGYDKHYLRLTTTLHTKHDGPRHVTTIEMPTVGYYQGYTQDSEGKYLSWSDSHGNREMFRYEQVGTKKNGEPIYDCITVISTIRFIFDEERLTQKEFNEKYHQWMKDKRLDTLMTPAIINAL